MNIHITSELVSADLGRDWEDANKAADDLAAYKELTWLNDLQSLIDEGHNIDMDIIIDHDTYGPSRRTEVVCESPSLQQKAMDLMTEEDVIWQRFLNDMHKEE